MLLTRQAVLAEQKCINSSVYEYGGFVKQTQRACSEKLHKFRRWPNVDPLTLGSPPRYVCSHHVIFVPPVSRPRLSLLLRHVRRCAGGRNSCHASLIRRRHRSGTFETHAAANLTGAAWVFSCALHPNSFRTTIPTIPDDLLLQCDPSQHGPHGHAVLLLSLKHRLLPFSV
jgi:hypothetical protein